MKKQLLPILLLCALLGCKKDNNTISDPFIPTELSKAESKDLFSKVLAKAVKNDKVLRDFIKTESLKEFDKDNDVLISMVSDIKLSDGQTLHEKLLKAGLSNEQYEKVLNVLPTLTILVPTVPNFSPSEWNTTTEIPSVASSPSTSDYKSIKVFDAEEKIIEVPLGLVPGFPVLVVKENERVNATINGVDRTPISARALSSKKQSTAFYNKDGKVFSFSNEGFDNRVKITDKISRIAIENASTPQFNVDSRVIEAYNKGYREWQRDYVYFGIDPASGVTTGPLNRRYKEVIRAIKMVSDDTAIIGDQSGDPTPTKAPYTYVGTRPGSTPRPTQEQLWFEGSFDIRIAVTINSKNGIGQVLNYAIPAKGHELYNITYQQAAGTSNFYYLKADPKEFIVNLPIDSWDLENYGSTWKFTVSEYDLSEKETRTVVNSTKYTTNFQTTIGFGEKFKVGAQLGGSIETLSQATYSIETTKDSDFLGEGILNFSDPIVTGKRIIPGNRTQPSYTEYTTWDVNTGKILLSIEPVLITQ